MFAVRQHLHLAVLRKPHAYQIPSLFRLKAVPPALLSSCSSLATLSLHSNPITAEQLRETEGYAAFDERRRKKYDKQVGGGAGTGVCERAAEGNGRRTPRGAS